MKQVPEAFLLGVADTVQAEGVDDEAPGKGDDEVAGRPARAEVRGEIVISVLLGAARVGMTPHLQRRAERLFDPSHVGPVIGVLAEFFRENGKVEADGRTGIVAELVGVETQGVRDDLLALLLSCSAHIERAARLRLRKGVDNLAPIGEAEAVVAKLDAHGKRTYAGMMTTPLSSLHVGGKPDELQPDCNPTG